METLIVNERQETRLITFNGEPFYVVPMTMVVPGVLNGSQGALFYGEELLSEDPPTWNMMPVTWGHPTDSEGREVSARTPEVLQSHGLGWVFNTVYNGKLIAEAWVNKARLAEFDATLPPEHRVAERLEAGKPVELSTGLFTYVEEVTGNYKGNPYTHVVKNFRPDHLAVLADQPGACSVNDGCGLNVFNSSRTNKGSGEGKTPTADTINTPSPQKTPTGSTVMIDRKKVIGYLTANCDCWKGDKAKVLEGMSDEQLVSLKSADTMKKIANAAKKKGMTANKFVKAVRNAEGEEGGDAGGEAAGVNIAELGAFLEVAIDPASDPVGYTTELLAKLDAVMTRLKGAAPAAEPAAEAAAEAAPAEVVVENEDDDEEEKPTSNRRKTFATMLATHGTETEKAVWNNAVAAHEAQKRGCVAKLTRHLTGNAKAAKSATLAKRTLADLQDMVALIETANPTNNRGGSENLYVPTGQASFTGAGYLPPVDAPTFNAAAGVGEEDAGLPLPSFDIYKN